MKEVGEKTRFSFCETECILAEKIEPNPQIIMFWEQSKEICPHCKETFVKGQHHLFNIIEFWLPITKTIDTCSINDIYVLGFSDTAYLLLTKDKMKEALAQSKVLQKLLI